MCGSTLQGRHGEHDAHDEKRKRVEARTRPEPIGHDQADPCGRHFDDFVLSLSRRQPARVCFLPTASGDRPTYITRFYRAMSFYETVLVPGYYRSGEGRKEGALRMLRVLRAPGPVPYTWRPPRTEDT